MARVTVIRCVVSTERKRNRTGMELVTIDDHDSELPSGEPEENILAGFDTELVTIATVIRT